VGDVEAPRLLNECLARGSAQKFSEYNKDSRPVHKLFAES